MSVDELVKLVKKASLEYYSRLPEEILITGGEPALKRDYLLRLVSKLDFAHTILETNAYLLDEDYIDQLIKAGVDEFMVDLKAWDEKLHRWYTGFPNRRVLENIKILHKKAKLIIKTIYIPGIVDEKEIERIAKFIATIDPRIEYRINDFKPVRGISRNPTVDEMEKAYSVARKYLKNVVISKSCRREGKPLTKRTWITVFPDGTFKRRSLKDYRCMPRDKIKK